ncbi:GMC family oxidoreductase N-terminal domain-containing protein [Solwaraspora sp. WMMD791]|uniref:GMC family oxidoreductase N-terminal domain-containing protein n=1 Tax=Solwaraspora sp. WMMD791 TaxID=3016086 RepID=UPI00249AC254|nr:GMC family oxidoreductase N-terminal domain-containing protein [Solwaraspora sp. WMMD791]WFE28713.1 GMC family oxidoreductase N-terminal domain-containing protein [Solwaraspora sp. WMMD791]
MTNLHARQATRAGSGRTPAWGGKLCRTRYDWDYDSHDEPQLNGRRFYLPRGRVLGGTSG